MSMKFKLGTKAETIKNAQKIFGKKYFLKAYFFSVKEWKTSRKKIIRNIEKKFKKENYLIVRSSCLNEDTAEKSNAGAFESILNVKLFSISKAVNKVISSYDKNNLNQVLIQPMMQDVALSGVVMTRDIEDNAPYVTINYDDYSGSTNSITGGSIIPKKLYIHHSFENRMLHSKRILKLVKIIKKISRTLNYLPLDIEFAINKKEDVKIFQIRSIKRKNYLINHDKKIVKILKQTSRKFKNLINKNNYFTKKTIFTSMSDWNPAEMIGEKPSKLSYSLYETLITNSVWSRSRTSLGYKKCDTKLMYNFLGKPFINTKSSFSSFLPSKLPSTLAKRIVSNNLNILKKKPEYHDKIEFKISDNCNYVNFKNKYKKYYSSFLTKKDFDKFYFNVVDLTNELLNISDDGFLKKSIKKIDKLKKLQKNYKKEKIKKLIDDCKNYGTFYFSIIARLAFVAEKILRSLTESKIISEKRISEFKNSINSITKTFVDDYSLVVKKKISKKIFFQKYGHLRPSTYDISAKKYSELNFQFTKTDFVKHKEKKFNLTSYEKSKINNEFKKNNILIDAENFFNFAKKAISNREYSKFIFSKNISMILDIIKIRSKKLGISLDEISILKIGDFIKHNDAKLLNKIKISKKNNKKFIEEKIKLNFLLCDSKDFYVVPTFRITPNFTGEKIINKKLIFLKEIKNQNISIADKIVCIENADPGYDWIFTKKIAGLITINGGSNSHMFIRCNEFNITSAIGCGDILFKKIISKKSIVIDPNKKKIIFNE